MQPSERRSILFAITATQFAIPFMLSGVGIALPVIGRELGASAVNLSLVESTYVAAVAMFLLPVGRLCDMFGGGLLFTLGLALYTLVTFVLGFVADMNTFVLLRIVQGFAGSLMVSPGMAILTEAYPPEERGKAIGISVTGVYLGISAGPYLGGLITTALGWRWLLFLSLAPIIISLWMACRALPLRFERRVEGSFDWIGALLATSGIGLAVFGSATIDEPYGMYLLILGLLSVVGFIIWEHFTEHPLLDMHLFHGNRPFSFGNLAQYINYTATFGVTFLLSIFFQYGKGMTAHEAGTILVIPPITMAVFSSIAGKMSDKMATNRIAGTGMLLSITGLGMASLIGLHTPLWQIVITLFLLGLGTAFFATPNMCSIMGSVGPRHLGVASAMTAAMRTSGMTSGMIFITMAMAFFLGKASVTAENLPQYISAMHTILGTLTVVGIPGIIITFLAVNRPASTD